MGKLVADKSRAESTKGDNEAVEAESMEEDQGKAEAEDEPGDEEVANLNATRSHLVNYKYL